MKSLESEEREEKFDKDDTQKKEKNIKGTGRKDKWRIKRSSFKNLIH